MGNKYRMTKKQQKETGIAKKKRISSIKTLITKNKLSKALNEVYNYLEDYPNDSYGLIQEANILMMLTYYDEAEEVLDIIIENNLEGKFSALYKKGIIARINDDKVKAEELFRKNIEESPYPEIYTRIGLANIEYEKGNYENAFKLLDGYYDREIDGETKPNIFAIFKDNEVKDAEYLKLTKIRILINLRRVEEAEELYNMVNLNNDINFMREYNLVSAILNRNKGNYEEALSYLDKISAGPEINIYWDTIEERARAKLGMGYPIDAIEISKQLLNSKNKSNHLYALEIIGEAYIRLEDYEKARETYLKTDDLYSDGEGLIGAYRIGKMEYKLKNYNKALEYFNMIDFFKQQQQQQTLEFYRMLALLKTKKYSMAYRKVLKIDRSYLIGEMKDDAYFAKIFLRKMLNLPIDINPDIDSYTKRQIVDYSKEETIKRIDRIHTKNGKTSEFNKEINFGDLIDEIPMLIKQDSTIILKNTFRELYQIEYPNIGYTNNGVTNSLNVSILPTGEVITMYPSDKRIVYQDNVEAKKVMKKSSRIEQFNRRYSDHM